MFDPLTLCHPATKEVIYFDQLSLEELIDLEIVATQTKSSIGIKISAIESQGDEPSKTMQDMARYCGLITQQCQLHKAKLRVKDDRFARLSAVVDRLPANLKAIIWNEYTNHT